MIRLKTKLMSGATSLLLLSTLSSPVFAETDMHTPYPDSSDKAFSQSFGSNFPFGDFKLDDFFGSIFDHSLEAEMSGDQEIPGPGDPDGTGEATVKLKPSKNQICVEIETKYLDTATAAHIHHAPKGSAGAVVVPLPIPDSAGMSSGCVDVDGKLVKAIKDNPQDYYVNIHTNTYPEGAIRGQLAK